MERGRGGDSETDSKSKTTRPDTISGVCPLIPRLTRGQRRRAMSGTAQVKAAGSDCVSLTAVVDRPDGKPELLREFARCTNVPSGREAPERPIRPYRADL